MNLQVDLQNLIRNQKRLVAAFDFYRDNSAFAESGVPICDPLVNYITLRETNRNLGKRQSIPPELLRLRAPGHGGHESGMMTDTVPAPWRTRFREYDGQFGGSSGMVSAMTPERLRS